jgi:hypothetical protein
MSVSVLTRAYNNARTGANLEESVLTAAAVRSRGIKRLFSLQLPGDRRGAEAQPLIVPAVRFPNGQTRDLVLLATMANRVFAFDANDGTPVWERTLGTPINGSKDIDFHLVNDHWGVLSTPVIDGAAGVMYACVWASPDGSPAKAQHWLHAVSIADGHAVHPPLNLEGAVYEPGHGLPPQRFASAVRKQRASLLLAEGTVFIPFGSLKETSRDSRGWIIACDTHSWRITAAWAAAAKGFGGGIWQAGSGLAADRDGFIYCMTGNGTFDAVTDWAECFVKLKYTAPAAGRSGSISVVDWWTPWTDDGRSGLEPSGDEFSKPNPTNLRVYTIDHKAGWDDMDLGSGGPVVIDDTRLVAGAGKDGILYVLKKNAMGMTRPRDLDMPAGNYAKLAAPPIWFTFFPGPQVSPTPNDISALNQLFFQRTHHQHGAPLLAQCRAWPDAVLLGRERKLAGVERRGQRRGDLSCLQRRSGVGAVPGAARRHAGRDDVPDGQWHDARYRSALGLRSLPRRQHARQPRPVARLRCDVFRHFRRRQQAAARAVGQPGLESSVQLLQIHSAGRRQRQALRSDL